MKLFAAIWRNRAARPEHLLRGRRGEDLAYRHLRKLGYTMVARNYRTRDGRGEVDLIGLDQGQHVFVEVKTRSSDEFGSPDSAIDTRKRLNIIRAASDYLRRAGLEWHCARFDTVNVILREPPEIELLKDAFSRRSLERGSANRRRSSALQQRGAKI